MVEWEKKLIKLIRIAAALSQLFFFFFDFLLRIRAKCVSARLDLLFQRSAFQWLYRQSIALLWWRWNDLAARWMRPTAAGRRFAGAITVGTKPNHSFWPSFAYANVPLWRKYINSSARRHKGHVFVKKLAPRLLERGVKKAREPWVLGLCGLGLHVF